MFFKGFDRTKYDLHDPAAWHAIERDRALHEEALATVERYLNTPLPRQRGATIPQILLAPEHQPTLTAHVPEALQNTTYAAWTPQSMNWEKLYALPVDGLRKKF